MKNSKNRNSRLCYYPQTVVEGKKKIDFSEYEIQLLDMRTPKTPFKHVQRQQNAPKEGLHSQWFWGILNIVKQTIVPLIIIASLTLLILLVSALDNRKGQNEDGGKSCSDKCVFSLVESIPENLTYAPGSPIFTSTFSAWNTLLDNAEESIEMAVFYWTMKNEDVTPFPMPSSWEGEEIFKKIIDTGKQKGVNIRVAQNSPSRGFPQNDSKILVQEGAAQVRSVDFSRLLGGGVLHTKMWIVDGAHVYLGSANMDWQSLTQVKELGVLIQNCSCLAQDMQKIFEVYWFLGQKSVKIPSEWPKELQTIYDLHNPMLLSLSDTKAEVFASSSPLPFNPLGRTNDIDAICNIMQTAKKFIYVAVMDYFPRMLFSSNNSFWPVIDNEIRRAALDRKVEVRLMASHWNHTRLDLVRWLKSLQDLSGAHNPAIIIKTKLFVVPAYTEEQKKLPFARVNHNKYMVTETTAYVGTSNWSGDYFTNTAGVSISVTEKYTDGESKNNASFRRELQSLFERDWNSEYAKPLEEFV